MAHDTIPARLLARARDRGGDAAHHVKHDGGWRAHTWADYARDVSRAARALIALGLPPGASVAILASNSREWAVLDVACMAIGGAPAGIYPTCSAAEMAYIANHCEAPLLAIGSAAQWDCVQQLLGELPRLRCVVALPGCEPIEHRSVIPWDAFLALGDPVPESRFLERVEALRPDQLASLIYTSGTTGPPKGVMLSHDNLVFTADVAHRLFAVHPGDCVISYLPLAHIAEQMFTIHGPIALGFPVWFAESLARLPDNLKEVQPTLFFGVPRIWEKLQAAVVAQIARTTGPKRWLLGWARWVARRVVERRKRGRAPGPLMARLHRLATRLVFDQLKPALGLGRARLCITGAAPIAGDVLAFFQSLDLVVHEIYGQSEDTGPTTFNQPGRVLFGSVGQAIPGIELRLADDGEVCVRGRNVFLGYHKDPAATAETLRDGWLLSGDLGRLDRKGFLHLTGRKKDILITAGGKNVAPGNIEGALKRLPLVDEAVVIGDRRKYLTALITLDLAEARLAAGEAEAACDRLAQNEAVRALVTRHVETVNRDLARVEQVKHFRILPRGLTVEDGELTPTLKVRRSVVVDHWAPLIDSMYTAEAERAIPS